MLEFGEYMRGADSTQQFCKASYLMINDGGKSGSGDLRGAHSITAARQCQRSHELEEIHLSAGSRTDRPIGWRVKSLFGRGSTTQEEECRK